jgi:non-canonical purine NTP pyrophosphatase (RdgB/HAM1 family)
MQLLLATTNPGKTRELRWMLEGADVELADLSGYKDIPEAKETGHTFAANACLKASYYARGLVAWTLADDSGLSVDALGGKPGVHSARWAALHGRQRGDAANNALVLEQLRDIGDEHRTARFVCTLALSDPQGRILLSVTDWVEGQILREERGAGGFGYDPLFYVQSHGQTTAQMSPDEKNAISHRGKAMRRMAALIRRYVLKRGEH